MKKVCKSIFLNLCNLNTKRSTTHAWNFSMVTIQHEKYHFKKTNLKKKFNCSSLLRYFLYHLDPHNLDRHNPDHWLKILDFHNTVHRTRQFHNHFYLHSYISDGLVNRNRFFSFGNLESPLVNFSIFQKKGVKMAQNVLCFQPISQLYSQEQKTEIGFNRFITTSYSSSYSSSSYLDSDSISFSDFWSSLPDINFSTGMSCSV